MAPPLITFVILAYNQEDYIADAVKGAFAQKYANLDILISDDCSRDATYSIVSKLVAEYRGEHRVTCRQNPANLGIAGHVNAVNALAAGELIIIAAGDDISLPMRSQRFADAFIAGMGAVHYLYSPAIEMDLQGRTLDVVTSPGARDASSDLRAGLSPYPVAIGATQAWSKELVRAFAPLGPRVWAEDQILGFRGLLLGNIGYIDEPLVYYRTGGGISTRKNQFSLARYFKGKMDAYWIFRQRAADARRVGRLGLACMIAFKATLIVVCLPVAPLLSAVKKLSRAGIAGVTKMVVR